MARWLAGIIVETQRVVVRAPGAVGAPACVDDPHDCCAADPPVRDARPCCPDEDLLRLLAFVCKAPAGLSGDEVAFVGDLIPLPPGAWATDGEVEGTGGLGAADTRLSGDLYCDPALGLWYFEGSITDAGGTVHEFRIELVSDGVDLIGTADVPGLGEVRFAAVAPCPDAIDDTLTDCVTVDPEVFGCAHISSQYAIYDETSTEVAVVKLMALAEPRFRSDDAEWELYRDLTGELAVWRLEHLDGRRWFTFVLDCCEDVPFQSGELEGPTYTAHPVFDCCGEGGTDPGGDISKCGCDGIGNTLYATFGGALAAYGTQTLTWDGGLQEWRVTPGATACNAGVSPIAFRCVTGTTWSLATSGSGATPSTVFGATATATSCSPLTVSFSGTATSSTGGCVGAWTATVSEVAP